jgi:hypothetical protein
VSVQTTPMRYNNSVTLTDTRVTGSDCGRPENELSELVRSGGISEPSGTMQILDR